MTSKAYYDLLLSAILTYFICKDRSWSFCLKKMKLIESTICFENDECSYKTIVFYRANFIASPHLATIIISLKFYIFM